MATKRWAPQVGNVVAVDGRPKATWSVFAKSPERASWWLIPVNDEAKAWAERHPHSMVTGATSVPSKEIHSIRPKGTS